MRKLSKTRKAQEGTDLTRKYKYVEGFENAVLDGSRDTIKRNRPWLLIEDNGQQDQHRQWLNDLCGPYESAPVKSKSNTIWIPK